MKIEVVIALPDVQHLVALDLPEGARIADVMPHPDVGLYLAESAGPWDVGVWGNRCAPETALREGDRVEFYRPLQVDAKSLRRERAAGAPRRKR